LASLPVGEICNHTTYLACEAFSVDSTWPQGVMELQVPFGTQLFFESRLKLGMAPKKK
jgi:hypothetical protein